MTSQPAGSSAGASPDAGRARLAAFALLIGNFVIGLSILAPAAMIDPLAISLDVSVRTAALLITGGAIVLCIGSPLVASTTATFDRRRLLSAALALLAASHVASALAPDFTILFAIRLAAMAVAAVFTPQAASAIAMIVPERERPAAISFVFLGWSLAAAGGLPLVAWFADAFGWQAIYLGLAIIAAIGGLLVHLSVPSGLRSAALSRESWGVLLRDRLVLTLLLATIVASAGQFVVITYLGPLMLRVADAATSEIAITFALFGIAGFVGNVVATRIVGRIGALNASLVFFALMAAGALVWALGAGAIAVMATGAAIWGLGFASSNSMQQARLAAAAPAFSGAAIALNSAALYVGQAVGSGLGGAFFEKGLYSAMNWTTVLLLVVTIGLVATTRRGSGKAAG